MLKVVTKSDANPSQNAFKGLRGLYLIEIVKISFYALALSFLIIGQSLDKTFINLDFYQPLMTVLTVGFLFHTIMALFSEKLVNNGFYNGLLYFVDTCVITQFVFTSDQSQSLYLFLYLVNIILCGIQYRSKGAISLAIVSALFFNFFVTTQMDFSVTRSFLVLFLNNVTLFLVAGLSGQLSHQMDFLDVELTESKKDTKLLKELNDLIIENISSALVTTDLDFNILQANEASEKVFKAKDVSGENLDVFFPELVNLIYKDGVSFNKNEFNKIEVEQYINKSMTRLFDVVISPLKTRQGENRGYIFILDDVTEVRNLENKLRQNEKLAAVGQLAAGIAHEIRNPLASISGSVQLLSSSMAVTTEEDKKLSNIVLKEIDRLNDLISEFLDYVRPDEEGEDIIEVSKLSNEILEMIKFNDFLPKNIEQDKHLNSKSVITGNRDKLKQAILNVVINAYQAMESAEDPKLSFSTWDEENKLFLRISDNGQGIEKSQLQRIFEPFHTTKPKGTGLGLAITHKIFESHNADVQVDSEVGRGTTFTITFDLNNTPLAGEQKLA